MAMDAKPRHDVEDSSDGRGGMLLREIHTRVAAWRDADDLCGGDVRGEGGNLLGTDAVEEQVKKRMSPALQSDSNPGIVQYEAPSLSYRGNCRMSHVPLGGKVL